MGNFKGWAEDKKSQISFGLDPRVYNTTEKLRRKIHTRNRSVLCAAIYEYGLNLLLNKDQNIINFLEIKLNLKDLKEINFEQIGSVANSKPDFRLQ